MNDLQQQAKRMEYELEEWNKTVSHARNNFYDLNYYTTRQLLILRSELGKIKSLGLDCRLPYVGQVMTLLKSLSSEITPSALERVVNLVSIECNDLEEKENSPQTDEMHHLNSTSSSVNHSQYSKGTGDRGDHKPSLPPVSLSHETLNEKQKSHCTDIIEYYGYSQKTALKAIEEVDDGDWNDIVNWIEENGDKWEQKFNECQESEEEEEEVEDVDTDEESEKCDDQERELQESCTSMFYLVIW